MTINGTPSTHRLFVKGLTKRYSDGTQALAGVDLRVDSGLYGLLGPNGAGKSTLMRTLATLQSPDEGTITFDGIDLTQNPEQVRRILGYLPQQIGAYPGVTGCALLARFAWLKGRTQRAEREREVAFLLERVNLSNAGSREVATYSGGMLRRFGIALALIGAPKLLIVDEPTAGLDPAERNRFHQVLADVASEAIVLLSTHIVDDVESLCAKLAILHQGRIIAEGTPAELTAPLDGKLWYKDYIRGEPAPENLEAKPLNTSATPTGTRALFVQDTSPGPDFTLQTPKLDHAYHYFLARGHNEAAA